PARGEEVLGEVVPRADAEREGERDGGPALGEGAEGAGERFEPLLGPDARVAAVAQEDLVAAVPREDDRHLLARELRDGARREERAVGEGLVVVPGEALDPLEGVGLQEELGV